MDEAVAKLVANRDSAVRELLALERWPCSRDTIERAIAQIVHASAGATSALAWLLLQASQVPHPGEHMRRLRAVADAAAALRATTAGSGPGGASPC
jgi:hypothetical protein